MIDIKDFWIKLVYTGQYTDSKHVYAVLDDYDNPLFLKIDGKHIIYFGEDHHITQCKMDRIVVLRLEGVDKYPLKWRIPTEEDIGKKCWFKDCDDLLTTGVLDYVTVAYEDGYCKNPYNVFFYKNGYSESNFCLLAEHGNIAPNIEDFK